MRWKIRIVSIIPFSDSNRCIISPSVFFALRGGGAGSWGVIISATLRTFPTFTAVNHVIEMVVGTNASTGALAEIHARHIFDWVPFRAGQYFYFFGGGALGNEMSVSTFFPNSTVDQANAAMKPFLDDVAAANLNVTIILQNVTTGLANDLMFSSDISLGFNDVLGSRLIPMAAYRTNVEGIGKGVEELFELGVPQSVSLTLQILTLKFTYYGISYRILGHNLIGGEYC